MHNLLSKPLTWMIVAECAVVGALVLVAWHVMAARPSDAPLSPALLAPASQPDVTLPALPDRPSPAPSARGQLPGLNLNVDFWRLRLGDLNTSEAGFEALEWRIVHTAMDAAHRYVESVVIPAVVRAAGGEG